MSGSFRTGAFLSNTPCNSLAQRGWWQAALPRHFHQPGGRSSNWKNESQELTRDQLPHITSSSTKTCRRLHRARWDQQKLLTATNSRIDFKSEGKQFNQNDSTKYKKLPTLLWEISLPCRLLAPTRTPLQKHSRSQRKVKRWGRIMWSFWTLLSTNLRQIIQSYLPRHHQLQVPARPFSHQYNKIFRDEKGGHH